ncbi:FtsW/RodA/SpoVE family cell cycle protein, partial [Plantactinospora siamensis]
MPRLREGQSRRNAELGLLIFALLLVAAYSATVEANVLGTLRPDFWVPMAVLAGFFLALHVANRFLAPYADPVLVPAVALLNGIGVGFLRRLDLAKADPTDRKHVSIFAGLGGRQLLWT